MTKKLLLFDCDGTLWFSDDGDFISSQDSKFEVVDENTIKRLADGKKFLLKNGVWKVWSALRENRQWFCIGIVSDNQPGPVREALRLFDLSTLVDEKAINVRLWDGYCPKGKMIREIMERKEFKNFLPGDIFLIDDKDYSREMARLGISFIRVGKNLSEILKKVLS